LIKLAKSLVNLENRTQMTLSANPIHEAEPEKAKTYWFILRALGNLPSDEALAFLLEATQDEASDKREEALSSLIKLWSKSEGKLVRAGEVKNTLQKCLTDPAPNVRITAMEGAAVLNLSDLIGPLVNLINAQEMSVTRAALNTLEKLASNGHKDSIRAALTEAKQGQSNVAKVKRIDEFMQRHL
jgi:HEAT repeat protein